MNKEERRRAVNRAVQDAIYFHLKIHDVHVQAVKQADGRMLVKVRYDDGKPPDIFLVSVEDVND